MSSTVSICATCAWRATCQKKFSVSGRDMRCAEFVRDVTIKEAPQEEEPTKEKKKDKKEKKS
ncbi:MAG: hypothetical protein A2Y97_01590 [Nitrospirae bacterium RBG_13_39_12]|nr:MAG: hypothetical protein A2Y97_01590 [Nitrospirae bacterium RBG_13_39_12]